MIKVFISQPMTGMEEQNILKERERLIECATKKLKEDIPELLRDQSIYFIDSFIKGAAEVNPLFCLGHSITSLSKADYIFVAKNWHTARGCQVEVDCALKYGIPIIFE